MQRKFRNSRLRNSSSFKAQALSLAWLTHPAPLATAVSRPCLLPSLPFCPHTLQASPYFPSHSGWLLGPQPSSQGVWSGGLVRPLSPPQGVAHPPMTTSPPLYPRRGCDFVWIKEQCLQSQWLEHLHGRKQTPATVEVFLF